MVEREVSVIFDSLDPITRAMVFSLFMHSLHRGSPNTIPLQSWTLVSQDIYRNRRGKHDSDFASLPEHPAEEHHLVPVTPKAPPRRSMFLLRREPTPICPQTPSQISLEPPSWSAFHLNSKFRRGLASETPAKASSRTSPNVEPSSRAKPPEEQAMEVFQNALQLLKIGAKPGPATPKRMSRALNPESSMDNAYLRIMNWPHNTPFKTKSSKACPSKALTPLQFLLRKSICQAGHLYKLNGAFKNTTLFLLSQLHLPDPVLSLAACAAAAAAPVVESGPMPNLEKEVADDLAIQSLVRVQYKVYLFERILLCCNEINPNKPKNRVLKQPLVDKKGKPKLQLKGRIFMQNVTDVVTLSKHSTAGYC